MLVTFTNEGAAVRRVELSSPRYLDLHDRGGYLGHLELAADGGDGPAGASRRRRHARGRGAGVEVGDRLLEAGVKEPRAAGDAGRPGQGARATPSRGTSSRCVVERDGAAADAHRRRCGAGRWK